MKTSKLISVVQSLSDKEFKELIKFLNYKFENNDLYRSFADFLSANYPHFKDEKISKEVVFKKLFPNQKYEDIKVRELMSNTYKQVRDFLIYMELQSSDFKRDLALLKQFRKRKFDNLFGQQLKQLRKSVHADPLKNLEYTKREFLLAEEENQYFEDQRIRAFDESIQVKLDNLDIYYFSVKLRDTCEMLNRQRIINQQYDLNLLEEMNHIIEKNKKDYLNYPALNCYYEIYHLLTTEEDEKQLDRTISTLNDNIKYFNKRELKSMYDYALNYCIRHVNQGNTIYVVKLFDLQKVLIEKEIMLDKGELSHISYKNIVSIALKLKEYKWSAKFIEQYRANIAPKYRENAYNLNKAYLLYATEEYDETISLLNQVDFTDVYYACSAKFTLLKAYYALQEYETLEYFVTAFNLYLKRNAEISPAYKKSSQNFVKTFKKILILATKLDYFEMSKIEHKKQLILKSIEEEKEMANRAWLLEKMEEIKL